MREAPSRSSDRIEILSVTLLDSLAPRVREFRELSKRLGSTLGWHYLLDLSWAAHHIGDPRGMRVLDAGSGNGLMQWWLVERGADVIAVDRLDRREMPVALRARYKIEGLRADDLAPWPRPSITSFLPPRSPRRWGDYSRKLATAFAQLRGPTSAPRSEGTLHVYHADLTGLRDVRGSSVDAVVSISALEHNSESGLRRCVTELVRVLKPGGRLIATLGAARDSDWFHEPSGGWCYTDATLLRAFGLAPETGSNYDEFDRLFEALRNCEELERELDPAYALSGDNGMPWGVWDPKYQTVGVITVKSDD